MLKFKYLITTILIILLLPSLALAVQWEARNDVSPDKVWQILFSQPVDTQSINNSIYINDSQGNTVSSVLTPSADGKTIVVDAVPDYLPGQQYYLHISDLIKSAQQSPIKEPIILPFTIAQSQNVKVHFIDVGLGVNIGDSIYIQLPNHKDILIDGGFHSCGQTVVNYLKEQGVDDIELMIATHPHDDHMGGLLDVLDAYEVEEIIDNGQTADSEIYNAFAASAKAEGCSWAADDYQSFTWDNVTLQILTGNEVWSEANDYSIVCRLDCGDIEFLFMGDAYFPVEDTLSSGIDAEILKVGHHGFDSSTSPSFLSRVNPEIAVISVPAKLSYKLQTTLNNIEAARATVYRTDLNGNIVVTTDGSTYSVNSTGVAPVLSSSEVTTKGDVSLTFNKDMADPTGIGAEGQFTVQLDNQNATVTSVVCTNTTTKIKLLLDTKVTDDQTVTVAYTKSDDETKQIKSTDGCVLKSFTAQTVSNTQTGPESSVFTVNGNAVTAQSYSMEQLKAMTATTDTYPGKNDATLNCTGVSLASLLNGLDDNYSVQINITDAATYPIDPVTVSAIRDAANKYLLTYEVDGQAITTDASSLRIYWSGKVIKNVTGITITSN